MSKRIIVEVDENGEIKIETVGFQGKGCIEESQWVKDLIGKEISQQLTPAYFTKTTDKEKRTKHLPICG